MMRAPLVLAVSTALFIASTVQAQVMLKPGLWELNQRPQLDAKRQAQLDQAQKTLANLPPEQRKMMEQMLAQHGVNVDIAGGVIIAKVCLTEEQARRNSVPVSDSGNCSNESHRSGDTIKAHFSCANPASTGDTEVTLTGDGNGFTSKSTVTRMGKDGKPETMSITGDAHWLGQDCGGLKPAGSK